MATTSKPVRQLRRRWPTLGAVAIVTVIALAIAGMLRVTVRTFALGSPNQNQVALLRVGSRVCEGPVTSPSRVDAVAIWGASVIGPARVGVDVEDAATGRSVSSGAIRAAPNAARYTAHLARPVSGGASLRLCLTGRFNTFALLGSEAVVPDVVMTGAQPGREFSLVLLQDRRSLVAWLPTAFARASLFKPAWVGSSTFWVLLSGLVITFGLGVTATLRAAADDDDDQIRASSQRTTDQ